jgi:hypothetical protein
MRKIFNHVTALIASTETDIVLRLGVSRVPGGCQVVVPAVG